jgi:hypothetical protein
MEGRGRRIVVQGQPWAKTQATIRKITEEQKGWGHGLSGKAPT